MSELVDSEVIFRGFASCEDSDGAHVAQYFIVPREKGGFVTGESHLEFVGLVWRVLRF
jgi:hypothetical protein